MPDNDSINFDGRGRGAGSRTTQFGRGNQAARKKSRAKKPPQNENAVDSIRKAIFQELLVNVNGKKRKVFAIDALMQKIVQGSFSASLGNQIKFFNVIANSGAFDVEEYRRRISSIMEAKHNKLVDMLKEINDTINIIGPEYKRVTMLHIIYRTAFEASLAKCDCGACERGFDTVVSSIDLLKKEIVENQNGDFRDDGDDDDGDGIEFGHRDLEEESLDPNFVDDPSLDIANGELTLKDLIAPACSDDGEAGS